MNNGVNGKHHEANGEAKPLSAPCPLLGGGAGGHRDTFKRSSLQLLERIVDSGRIGAENLGELYALADHLAKHHSPRVAIRAAQLKAKLLELALRAAEAGDRQSRLDAGSATEIVAQRTYTIEFDRAG